MARQYPHLPFERYADDAIMHCRTKREAKEVWAAIAARLKDYRLELHPAKTTVVYCKDEDRRGNDPNEKFDFLGYTFRTTDDREIRLRRITTPDSLQHPLLHQLGITLPERLSFDAECRGDFQTA